MRKLIRRLEKKPDQQKTSNPSYESSVHDELFMKLLKKHHIKSRYQYMKDWWQKTEQDL